MGLDKIENYYNEKIAKDFLSIEGVKEVKFDFYEYDGWEDNNSFPRTTENSNCLILLWQDGRQTRVNAHQYEISKEEVLATLRQEKSDIQSINYNSWEPEPFLTRRQFSINELIERLYKEKDNQRRQEDLKNKLTYSLAKEQGLTVKTKEDIEVEMKDKECLQSKIREKDKKIEELRHRSLLKRILNKEDKGLQR